VSRAFIAVGSNLDPDSNVYEGIRRLGLAETLVGISSLYRTPAEDRPEQPDYTNGVVAIETETSPRDLKFGTLRRIEEELGRTRGPDRFAARTIDLDLIWYDDLVLAQSDFTLPDPQILERPYLALPLAELAPRLIFPGSGLCVGDIAAGMSDDGMQPLTAYRERLGRLLASASSGR